jgi:hypothetical protein
LLASEQKTRRKPGPQYNPNHAASTTHIPGPLIGRGLSLARSPAAWSNFRWHLRPDRAGPAAARVSAHLLGRDVRAACAFDLTRTGGGLRPSAGRARGGTAELLNRSRSASQAIACNAQRTALLFRRAREDLLAGVEGDVRASLRWCRRAATWGVAVIVIVAAAATCCRYREAETHTASQPKRTPHSSSSRVNSELTR